MPFHRSRAPKARRVRLLNDAVDRTTFEMLERRVLMCGSAAEMIAAGVPESMIMDDGHIREVDFRTLPAKLQAHIDRHLVLSEMADSPIDWDKVMGIPASVSNPGGRALGALPDFFPALYGGTNSLVIDQSSQGGRTLLKFGTQVNNQGEGPCSLLSGRPGIDTIPTGAPITSWTNPDGSQNVLQAVYSYNGTRFTLDHYQLAGKFTYHPGHGHFHYDGYANYRLRHNTGGQPGAYVQRADGTGIIGEKVGFCLLDFVFTNPPFFTESGQPSTSLPGYGKPGQPGNGCNLLQGVTVGSADGYSNNLQGQWLDVTGVPNGQYFLEISLDGENAVQETNENNNTKTFAYTLNVGSQTGGIPQDEYDAGNTGNDDFAHAADLGTLGTWQKTGLTVHWGQDFDYYKFVASSSGSATVSTTFSNGDVNIYLYDANQAQVGASSVEANGTTSNPRTETITYNFTAGQTYYFMVNAFNSTTSNNYLFRTTLKPMVDYATSVGAAVEKTGTQGEFVLSRNGPLDEPLTVTFALTGTATQGTDYTLQSSDAGISGNTVTFGDLTSTIHIRVVPVNDLVFEGSETVRMAITSSSTYVTLVSQSALVIYDSMKDADGGRVIVGRPDGGAAGASARAFARGPAISLFDDDDNRLGSLDDIDRLSVV